MARACYFTDASKVVKKIKKLYFVDESKIIKKARKGYIIDNEGIARKIYNSLDLRYKGTTTALPNYYSEMKSASTKSYAMFISGHYGSSAYNSSIITYDKHLEQNIIRTTTYKYDLAATSVQHNDESYAVFGGVNGGTTVFSVDDSTLEINYNIDGLSRSRDDLSAVSNNNYVLFGGGYFRVENDTYNFDAVDVIDIYDKNLTKNNITITLNVPCSSPATTTLGEYMIFAGGDKQNQGLGSRDESTNSVTVIDNSLTKIVGVYSLSLPRLYLQAASTKNYAIIGPGNSYTGKYDSSTVGHVSIKETCDVVDFYDTNLTRTSSNLCCKCQNYSAISLGENVIFAGGASLFIHGSTSTLDKSHSTALPTIHYTNEDQNLTFQQLSNDLHVARYCLAGAAVDDYALFAGGEFYNHTEETSYYCSYVDVIAN